MRAGLFISIQETCPTCLCRNASGRQSGITEIAPEASGFGSCAFRQLREIQRMPAGNHRPARARRTLGLNDVAPLVRRVIIGVIGGTVLLIGVALMVLPGPAFMVVPLGLAILATEFMWARRWLQKARSLVTLGNKQVRPPARPPSESQTRRK